MIETIARPWSGGVPLNPRTALQDLIAKVFSAPFAKTFSAPLGGAAAAVSWWLSGGIAAANCIAAYDAKNAASLAASYINLAKPGTYDLTEGTAPAWTAGTGWIGDGATHSRYLKTGITPLSNQTWSMILRYLGCTPGILGSWAGSADASGTNRFGITQIGSPLKHSFQTGSIIVGATDVAAAGIVAIIGDKGYLNGVQDATGATPGAGAALEIYILCRNTTGGAVGFVNSAVAEVAIYNTNILSYLTALNTAIAAL